jgi:hypothetical protein
VAEKSESAVQWVRGRLKCRKEEFGTGTPLKCERREDRLKKKTKSAINFLNLLIF